MSSRNLTPEDKKKLFKEVVLAVGTAHAAAESLWDGYVQTKTDTTEQNRAEKRAEGFQLAVNARARTEDGLFAQKEVLETLRNM